MQIKLDDFIYPGVTVTVDNVPAEKARVIQTVLKVTHAETRDALETLSSLAVRIEEQRRYNQRTFD